MAEGPSADKGGIHVSNVQGAFAIGDGNNVVNQPGAGVPQRDPAQEELLRAVRELRADLGRLVTSDQTAALDRELADTEAEIEETGRAGQGRLARIRQALADAGALTGLLASAAAVAQVVGTLSGS
ncbi:hypothetical protein [Streptomyces cavernae]|uniref:hypothetical protein n=1 Tax=Streptomyces cavernae TaxID=2259034 RepID=UPI000FEC1F8A|nr:hypothetical protein [Streptomyces cavernae]